MIFRQYKPGAGETYDLYTVPVGSSAVGTLYIAAQNGYDKISVQIIPQSILFSPAIIDNAATFILYQTPLVGYVPIYLQQLSMYQGDILRITSTTGDCSFTFTGELIS